MAARRRAPVPARSPGPISVQLLNPSRVVELHRGLALQLEASSKLDLPRLEEALAYAYDASTLGSSDCRAQATLVLLGFRELRPAGELDPALAFLSALALLDSNGFALDDVPYAEVTGKLSELADLRPEQGGVEGLHQWLVGRTKSAPPLTAPLPRQELSRLLTAVGLSVETEDGQFRVLRQQAPQDKGSWVPQAFRRPVWKPIHVLADPGEGLVGVAALRELRSACGLDALPFLDERAWQAGTLRVHRHLWPRLLGTW